MLKGEILNKYKEKFKILEDIREFQAISDFFPCGIIKIEMEIKILRLFNAQIKSCLYWNKFNYRRCVGHAREGTDGSL